MSSPDPSDLVDPHVCLNPGLSFEQHKELLLLQLEHSRIQQQIEREKLTAVCTWFQSFVTVILKLSFCWKWSDSEKTLLLQCVLTGKTQEAYCSLPVSESKSYSSVKKKAAI